MSLGVLRAWVNKKNVFCYKLLILGLLVLIQVGCTTLDSSSPSTPSLKVNSAEQITKPYVVLVSLDGFRFDYAQHFGAPNIEKIGRDGVEAEGLIPIYPTKTFPNHYSMATGLYSENHGLVSNEFWDPTRDQGYSMRNKKAVADGTWYGGTPLWNLAEKQGMISACFFWVGSEANIENMHPSHFRPYDSKIPNEERVRQVVEWLKLPEAQRPHLITLYMNDTDEAGHEHGPFSEHTGKAVHEVDRHIGELTRQLKELNLPINIIVVSDHGMEQLDQSKVISVDEKIDLSIFHIDGQGPHSLFYLKKGMEAKKLEATYEALKKTAKNFRVYKRNEVPERLHYRKSPRIGDLVIEVDPPYSISLKKKNFNALGGNHGYDPMLSKNMNGIFYASGPAFKKNLQIPAFENIHIYPLIAEILGLKIEAPIDGRLEVIKNALK